MITRRVLLFWLLVGMATVSPDPITVNINMSCDEPGLFWCGNVFVYEEDHTFTHDPWYNGSFCTNSTKKNIAIGPLSPGGDMSPNFEVGLQLTHNCSWDMMTRCYEPVVKDAPTDGPVVVDFNITIANRGIERECIHVTGK